MKKLQIRRAEPRDATTIAAGEHEVARTPGLLNAAPGEIPESAYRATIEALAGGDRGLYAVARIDDQLAAHLLLEPLPLSSRAHVCTLTIVVYPAWQRQGIGKALLRHGIQWARQNPGIGKIELTVRADNAAAISLYRSLGFEQEGLLRQRVKGTDGICRDDIAMALFVTQGTSD